VRVLLSAYACEPDMGSEPGVGWNWVRQISRFHEVWVITRANNRQPIEKALAKNPVPRAHWVYFDLPRWASFWKIGQRGVRAYYHLWQLGAYFAARKLHREVRFDLCHHVTFVNYWMPSFLALMPVPFVWGPVGGGESAPRTFWRSFCFRGKVYEVLRHLARSLGQLGPFVRLTARQAALAFATTQETQRRLNGLGCRRVSVLSEAGLRSEEINDLGRIPPRRRGPLRVLTLGRLLHWKGFDLGLRAFALFKQRFPSSEYWIVGDGPERSRLQKLAGTLGLADGVTFWGALPRPAALERLAECDGLLHPSLHDSGGWVCLEAMAAGRPVICLDLGGPALQVTEESGIKVPALSPEQAVRDLADALQKLASDPELRGRLSYGARKRVEEHFNWDKKGLFMAKLYEELPTGQEGMSATVFAQRS